MQHDEACPMSKKSGWFESHFSAKISKMQALPPLNFERKGSPGTGDNIGKVFFGQSQKGKSGWNLIMARTVRQNFNFTSESEWGPSYVAVIYQVT